MRGWNTVVGVMAASASLVAAGLLDVRPTAAQPSEGGATSVAPSQSSTPSAPRRTPVPALTKGKGESCVAPTEWIRRFHMTALNHQRDDTVHDGIRTPKFSLKGCIECHAVSGADGRPVTIKDERHFCRACHDYAAVQVDCFECHASRPEDPARGRDVGSHGTSAAKEVARLRQSIGTYLEGLTP